MLEICAEETGAGRTQLLYYIIARAILPDVYGVSILNGKNGAVVFIDTETHFDVLRLVETLTSYIKSKSSEEEPITDIDDLIERSLQHVHIFQPRTMSSMLETLSSLKDYLLDSTIHSSSNRAVHSIIIDSASAFYWDIRAEQETERINALDAKAPGASTISMPPPKPNPYALLVNRLRPLQQTFNCAVIATSTATRYKDPATNETIIRTLPAPWSSYPTAKLMLRREQVRQFAVGISWEDAEKDKLLRLAAVENGYFRAEDMGGGEGFKFAATREGVVMREEVKEVVDVEAEEEM